MKLLAAIDVTHFAGMQATKEKNDFDGRSSSVIRVPFFGDDIRHVGLAVRRQLLRTRRMSQRIMLLPGTNLIKLFASVIYECS